MPRRPREESQWNMYHVIVRGINRQLIFENKADKIRYLKTLMRYKEETNTSILCYCLMDNHVHLLIRAKLADMSLFIKKVGDSYIPFFNKKYNRIGPLFEGRFKSRPIETEISLHRVIRYIHNNPVRAGIAGAGQYPWSSYSEFMGQPRYCDVNTILPLIGNTSGFLELMQEYDVEDNSVSFKSRKHFTDSEAVKMARSILGDRYPIVPTLYSQSQLIIMIRALNQGGISGRQITRVTGIKYTLVQKAIRARFDRD